MRRTLIAVAAVALLASLTIVAKYALQHYRLFASRQVRLLALTEKLDLRLQGYVPSTELGLSAVPRPAQVVFVGHIYPGNEVRVESKPAYPDYHAPLTFFRQFVQDLRPALTVFGGDSVHGPNEPELEQLRLLNSELGHVKFLLGNHEWYWGARQREDFRELFGSPYGFEDIEGVRIIWLHSVNEDGSFGLDEEQRGFLTTILDPSRYRYALLFLHHALWAGDTIYANGPYPNGSDIARDWVDNITPMLAKGRVLGVFSGDGGLRTGGTRISLGGVDHFITGWTKWNPSILPEWLSIDLYQDSVTVRRYIVLKGKTYARVES